MTTHPTPSPSSSASEPSTLWTTVANAMDLPIGERLCVQINGRQVVLFNLDGQLRAIANTCPHAGRPLDDGLLHGHKLTCAYHGYSFDLKTGRCLNYQEDPPLRTFPVRIEQGQIQIATPHSTPATPGTL